MQFPAYLAFTNPVTLCRILKANGRFDARYTARVIVLFLVSVVMLPFNWLEHVLYGREIADQRLSDSPLIILGHDRSGTTHLLNLLSLAPQFAYTRPSQMVLPGCCPGTGRFQYDAGPVAGLHRHGAELRTPPVRRRSDAEGADRRAAGVRLCRARVRNGARFGRAMLKEIKRTLDANIDYGGAIMGATLLGAVVLWLNYSHGASRAAPAALKQATYTFFVAGFIVKNNERLARRWAEPARSLLLATGVSSALAVGLTFLVHSVKGTPEPGLSTLPTALMGPPGFLVLGWRARRKSDHVHVGR